MTIPELDITDLGRHTDDQGRQSIYSFTLYFDGDDESDREGGRISFDIKRRIEGSCELEAHGDYGPSLSDEEVWTGRALTAIDDLKGIAHAFRPTRQVRFHCTESIAPVTTAQQAHAAVAAFLSRRQDVPENVRACHLVIGDERLYMHEDRIGRMHRSHAHEGTVVQYSRGYATGGSEMVQSSRPHKFAGIDDMLVAMWQLHADVHGGVASMDDMSGYNEQYEMSDEIKEKFAELDIKRAQQTEEDKRRLRERNVQTRLADYQSFGINVRELLEADPFFEGQVDALMAAIDQSGAWRRDLVNGLASALEQIIEPVDDTGEQAED